MSFTGSYRDPKTQATSFVREPTKRLSGMGTGMAKQKFIPEMLFSDKY